MHVQNDIVLKSNIIGPFHNRCAPLPPSHTFGCNNILWAEARPVVLYFGLILRERDASAKSTTAGKKETILIFSKTLPLCSLGFKKNESNGKLRRRGEACTSSKKKSLQGR